MKVEALQTQLSSKKNTEDKSILQKILDGVNKMPKWKPATFKDKPISSSKILTFEF